MFQLHLLHLPTVLMGIPQEEKKTKQNHNTDK